MNLTPFLSTDETREAMMTPFSYGTFTYATDGRIIVRVDRRADIPERNNAPKQVQIEDIFRKATGADWMEVPTLPTPILEKCLACGGHGKIEWEKQTYECEECEGKGSNRKLIPVDICAQQFSDEYLEKIKSLPGAMIAPSITREAKPMPFCFDGGRGVMMPMRKLNQTGTM